MDVRGLGFPLDLRFQIVTGLVWHLVEVSTHLVAEALERRTDVHSCYNQLLIAKEIALTDLAGEMMYIIAQIFFELSCSSVSGGRPPWKL